MDELTPQQLVQLRRRAERLYKDAVKNLDLQPTKAQRGEAILQIMREIHPEISEKENTPAE